MRENHIFKKLRPYFGHGQNEKYGEGKTFFWRMSALLLY
jgi:hypothetical protein